MTLYACDLIKLPQYHIHDLEIKNKKCCVIFYYVQELLNSTKVVEYSINKPCPVNEKGEELNKKNCVRERYRERYGEREKERDTERKKERYGERERDISITREIVQEVAFSCVL